MNTKLDASVVLALALGCFASSANANMKYTPEYTNAWFSVESFSKTPEITDSEVGGVNGCWLAVPAGGVELASSALSIDTGVDAPLVYTNAAVGVGVSRIATKLTVTQSSDLPTIAAKTAICVCTNATGTATNWWAYVNNGWMDLAVSADIDTEYEIVLDSDSITGKIRYLVKKESDSDYTDLTGGWVDNSACSGAPITSISFAGSTTLAGFSGTSFAQGYAYDGRIYGTLEEAATAATTAQGHDFTVPVSDGTVVLCATIPQPWISANIKEVDSLADKAAKLDDTGTNGMKYWQSYVLALDPNVAASKPLVQPVQNTDAGTVAFTLGALPDSGVKVQYRVNAYDTPGSSTPSTEGSFVDADQSATMSLPGSGVKYYKLEVKFGE